MIVHIDPKEASQIRHSIIGDAVFTLVQDTVTKLNHEHLVSLSPIEVFASAQELYEALTGSEDVEEEIGYLVGDLRQECSEDDAYMVMVTAACLLSAMRKQVEDADDILSLLLPYYSSNHLHYRVMMKLESKEHSRKKKIDLLTYGMKRVEQRGGGSEEKMEVFRSILRFSDNLDKDTIKEHIIVAGLYNLENGHAYDDILRGLYDKLGLKAKTIVNAKEYVAYKSVDQEAVVGEGGVGFNYGQSNE